MKRRMQITNIVTLAFAAVAIAGGAVAQSIGIDVGDGVWDDPGEDNANGLQITATSFGILPNVAGETSVTVDGITFTLNIGGAEYTGPYADRIEILGSVNPGRYTGPVPWSLTGLEPDGLYDMAFLMYNGRPGTWTVNGVGSATPDADSDSNFEDVMASGSGVISGTWDYWTISEWCSFTALLVEYTEVIAEDTTPPTISTLNPTNNATGVVPEEDLTVTFSEPVQKGSGNIVIKEDGGSVFETIDVTSASISVSGMDVTINPVSDLSYGVSYYVEIDSGAITDLSLTTNDFAGISGDATWGFTTELPDTTAPTYTELSPVNEATAVTFGTDLLITFDEDVQKGSGNIVIKKIGGSIFETIAVTNANVTISGAVVTINPSSDLAALTEYYVEIDSGAIKDLGGPTPNDFAGFSGSTTWSFTAAKVPTVVSIDFDSNNSVFSGDPIHYAGMSIPGQVGPWHKLVKTASPTSMSIIIPDGGPTFTLNTTGVPFDWFAHDPKQLRSDFIYLNAGYADLTWELTGLVPRATYDIICYGRYVADWGGYRGGGMSINGGPVVTKDNGKETYDGIPNGEGDWNFPGVEADENGRIYGVLSHVGDGFAEFGAIQFDKVSDPIPSGTVIILR